jgi:hypothetical protein
MVTPRLAEFFSVTVSDAICFKTLARQQGSYDPAVGRDFAIQNVLRRTVGRTGEAKDIAFAVCMIASPSRTS